MNKITYRKSKYGEGTWYLYLNNKKQKRHYILYYLNVYNAVFDCQVVQPEYRFQTLKEAKSSLAQAFGKKYEKDTVSQS